MARQNKTKNYELIKAEFIDFLADPQKDKTQQDFAREKGINQATLSEWKQDPEFRENLHKRIDSLLGDELPKIYQVIKKKALEGDHRFVELALRQTGVLRDTTEVKHLVAGERIVVVTGIPRPNETIKVS